MNNVQALQSWKPVEARRTGLSQVTAATLFVILGAGAADAAPHLKHFGTGSTLQMAQGAERTVQQAGLSVELRTIKDALRLSVSELAQLFGVQRPSIYSWQDGKPTKESNAKRLREIARALEPQLSLLDAQVGRIAHRAIDGRATLLQKLAAGADAEPVISKLADILQREAAQRERLAARLRSRSADRGDADQDALG